MTRAELQRQATIRSLTASATYWRKRKMWRPAAGAERLLAQQKAKEQR